MLQTPEGSFFREWLPKSKPQFHFVKHLAVARGFKIADRKLAESFQRFLQENGYITTILVTEKNRLLRTYEPEPRMLRKAQSGFALILELVICCAVTAILMSAATVAIVRVRLAENQVAAKQRVRSVILAENASNWCAIPANACATPLTSTIPAPGSIVQSGYTFVFVNVGGGAWTYQAIPQIQGTGGTGFVSFYADNTGVLRCSAGTPATASSGPC